jgi:hypothetical protein
VNLQRHKKRGCRKPDRVGKKNKRINIMIKNWLDTNTLNLLIQENIVTDITITQPLRIGISEIHQAQQPVSNFLIIGKSSPNVQCEDCYFLPWKRDSGLYLDLPINNPAAKLFFTDGLSGCCVGIQRSGNMVRVCHYNIQGSQFDISDFERYNNGNSNRRWLIPDGYLQDADFTYYSTQYRNLSPSKLYWTYFWGEYDTKNNEWKFYYQSYDRIIHELPY